MPEHLTCKRRLLAGHATIIALKTLVRDCDSLLQQRILTVFATSTIRLQEPLR
jgi:hypothetical protein